MTPDLEQLLAEAESYTAAMLGDQYYERLGDLQGFTCTALPKLVATIRDQAKAIAELEPRAAFGDQCLQDDYEGAWVAASRHKLEVERAEELGKALEVLFNSCSTTHPDWGSDICQPDGNDMSKACAALAAWKAAKGEK